MSSELYIGLMTGTSLDSADAVLIDFQSSEPQLLAHHSEPLPATLRHDLLALTHADNNEISTLMHCDRTLGLMYSQTVRHMLTSAGVDAHAVLAIGSHGQTVRHAPDIDLPWTLQIGDPATLAVNTGIRVVADFRRQDIAAGGHGAPLAPGFHAAVFQSNEEDRIILNLGGIANISILPRHGAITGFDTGPANSLLDLWVQQHRQAAFDANGEWARSGTADHALLQHWIDNSPWLSEPPPKRTGRETFGLEWLKQHAPAMHKPEDIQATLVELTACTIADAITRHAPPKSAVYACGGGTQNGFLMERLTARLASHAVYTTNALGMDPQWVEAAAFAWLARQRILELPGNLPAVTGAKRPLVLGAIYHAN